MLRSRFRWLVPVCAALLGTASAQASSIVGRDVPYLARHAEHVVVGTVVAERVAYAADGTPFTGTVIAVDEAWKGRATGEVVLWRQGGPLADGSVLTIPGDVALAVGETAVVFASTAPDGRWFSLLLGWSVIEVADDGRLARSGAHLGVHLPDADGVLRPAPADAVALPASLSALEARVRETLGGAR